MRKEATIEQWKELYAVATRLKERKPWEKFWDLDIIGIRTGAEEDTVFYSILGRGGDCYGIVAYEGYEGLNNLMMLIMQERLNLSAEYVMASQRNLTCYWGNREELTEKQRSLIKELGYKYRGKNQWLYFLSFEPGYIPYNFDQDEVIRMTEHLENLDLALQYYDKLETPVDFENGKMFALERGEKENTWDFGEKPLPFTSFNFGSLILTDEELLSELKTVKKCRVVLEMDLTVMGTTIKDKEYKKPANPVFCMIADAKSGMMLKCEIQEPQKDPIAALAEELVGFIFRFGAPKEVRVSNIIVEAGLEQICQTCGIQLRRVKRLEAIDEFIRDMGRFI